MESDNILHWSIYSVLAFIRQYDINSKFLLLQDKEMFWNDDSLSTINLKLLSHLSFLFSKYFRWYYIAINVYIIFCCFTHFWLCAKWFRAVFMALRHPAICCVICASIVLDPPQPCEPHLLLWERAFAKMRYGQIVMGPAGSGKVREKLCNIKSSSRHYFKELLRY